MGRQAVEDGVEDTGDLARGDERRIERVEDLGMLPQRIGEGGAALDLALDRVEHPLHLGVRLLARQNLQALHKRQTGVDHGGKHTREDEQVLLRNAAEPREAD